jgi:peptidoglycan/xylan/chitin deacetylase (PgdA/CDA1 family)
MPLRSELKSIVEYGLLHSGAARIVHRRHRRDALILAYHNIVPDGEAVGGEASLHVPQRTFAWQLDQLRSTHDIVPLSALIDEPAAHTSRPRAVITFDDAYAGALTAGVAELRSRSVPATVFVAPGLLGGKTFWWDALAGGGELPQEFRTSALHDDEGRDASVRARATKAGLSARPVPAHSRSGTADDLDGALAYEHLSLGSHTWTHPNLSALSPEELSVELSEPRNWLSQTLRAKPQQIVDAIAYPYGLANETVQRTAQRLGYRAGLLVEGGWTLADRWTPFAIPRLNVPAGLSQRGFLLRLHGVLS